MCVHVCIESGRKHGKKYYAISTDVVMILQYCYIHFL